MPLDLNPNILTETISKIAYMNKLYPHDLIDMLPMIFGFADFSGKIHWCTPKVKHLLGYTPEEFIAHPSEYYLHPDDVEKTLQERQRLTESETQAIAFVNRYRHKKGHYVTMEWYAHSDPTLSGIFFVGLIQ